MKSISLGQYYPADSLIHRLYGRTKILLATIFIISVFLSSVKCIFPGGELFYSSVLSVPVSTVPLFFIRNSIETSK